MSFVCKKGKTHAHRKMVTRQQASDVLSYGYIVTTKAYAKHTQKCVEKLITLSKEPCLVNKRAAASVLLKTTKYDQKSLLHRLFNDISNKYKERNGGCTRLLRLKEQGRFILALV